MYSSQIDGFDFDAEAVLDQAIQPLPEASDLSAEPRSIFLTGVTGFVGAFLLHELLRQTSADIYCLVRASSEQNAIARIQNNLEQYLLWNPASVPRIHAVVGDLKLPLLGLTPDAFRNLANKMDVIYHCGSKLSYIAPYEFLKPANVGGTHEVLRLATTTRNKPVHYVSSLGILMAYKELRGGGEDDELDMSKCPDVGYFQSKYVAEKLVRIARDRGISVTIHRIGLIVGDSRTGVSNLDDFVARILIGSIQARLSPDIRNSMDMTPVDFVASAMVYLSRQPQSEGKVFHLLNPNPIHWSEIFDFVSEAGYPMQKLPFHQWVAAIEDHADPDTNPLYPLVPFFHINFARRMLGIDDSHFQALGKLNTQQALSGSDYVCPRVDRQLINTFLTRFVETGRLYPVTEAVSAASV